MNIPPYENILMLLFPPFSAPWPSAISQTPTGLLNDTTAINTVKCIYEWNKILITKNQN